MIVYADGSAYLQDQSGGWAWWVSDVCCDSGYTTPATNNTMEITAVLRALETLEWRDLTGETIEVVSDSAYVINCMTQRWYTGWRKRDWRKADGERVANRQLWEALLEVVERFPVPLIWTHVRGHGRGKNDAAHHVIGNDIVDRMAGAARVAGVGGVDQDWARRDALDFKPKPKRKLTMKALDGVTFVIEGGHRYVALSIEDDGSVLLLEEGK